MESCLEGDPMCSVCDKTLHLKPTLAEALRTARSGMQGYSRHAEAAERSSSATATQGPCWRLVARKIELNLLL